jgi:hypothetical protein
VSPLLTREKDRTTSGPCSRFFGLGGRLSSMVMSSVSTGLGAVERIGDMLRRCPTYCDLCRRRGCGGVRSRMGGGPYVCGGGA